MNELERVCAKMVCIGFEGAALTPEARGLIGRGVSTVVLFRRNVETPEQVKTLCADVKEQGRGPVMLCVDQEGGRVVRLKTPFTEVPSMRTLGRTGDEKLARDVGRLVAQELRAVNIDLAFAPVLDVDTNPKNPVIADRSLGATPELVSRLGCAIIKGLQENGVAACGKHFPGHGDTSQDSHHALPRLNHTLERLERVELPPFEAAVREGVSMIMTSHVIFEPLDPHYPATMSRAVLDGILRDRMKFDGVVISDDMEMKAIADHFGIEEAVVRGVNAGVDLFAICHQPELQNQAIDVLVRAVEKGQIPRARLDEAGRRLDALMKRFVKPAQRGPISKVVGAAEHRRVVDHILAACGKRELGHRFDPTEQVGGSRQ